MDMRNKELSLPGSDGEHIMQDTFSTQDKAKDFYTKQMLTYLAPQMQSFIQQQEMVFISTADNKGECDCSFRSGQAGFVIVLDQTRLAYAEFKGNGVMASMGNISENPHIGMLFLDFLEDKIGLHVNGKARIMKDSSLLNLEPGLAQKLNDAEDALSQKCVTWILIEVEEAYIHCSKNIPLFQKKEGVVENTKVDYFSLEAHRNGTKV